MDTHIQGPIQTTSLASVVSQRGYQFNFDDTFPKSICKIKATPKNPVFVELFVVIVDTFNAGTTNVLSVVTDQSVTLVDSSNINEALATVQAYTPVYLQIDAEIIVEYTQTGTAASAGKGILIVRASNLGQGGELKLQ